MGLALINQITSIVLTFKYDVNDLLHQAMGDSFNQFYNQSAPTHRTYFKFWTTLQFEVGNNDIDHL